MEKEKKLEWRKRWLSLRTDIDRITPEYHVVSDWLLSLNMACRA